MIAKLGIPLIALALAAATAMPAQARWYGHRYYHGWYGYHHGGNYNFGGPHYAASDFYHNSRQLTGTR
jgi:hypothetical protein